MIKLDRFGPWFATRGWAHLTLLTGAALFLFPFVWMVGVSLKTDDEAVTTQILPSVPVFRAKSPVIRPPLMPDCPQGVSTADWKNREPLLVQKTRDALQALPLPPGGDAVDADALRDAAAHNLAAGTIEKLSLKVWALPTDAFLAVYQTLLTPDVLADALNSQLGRLEFTGLQIHSLDGQIFNLAEAGQIAKQWTVISGSGQLLSAGPESAYLRYNFSSSSQPPIVIQTQFDAKMPADNLHKLVLSIKGDDSWHRIDIELTIGGRSWKSDLTTYIAQYRASSIIFQPPGFDDTTYRPRTWVPLVQTFDAQTNVPSTQATLRIIVQPSSTIGAILGKVQRNYLRAFRAIPFWTYVGNSVLLVALQMAGALLSSAFVAYAFARLQWPGRAVAFGILLGTMMLPSQVTMIPSFVIWRSLGWFNTLNPLWVPSWFGSGFFIFLMTQNMKTIPRELEEAARIDGLNALQTWWYIMLPLVKPTLAAIAIMVFMGAWNDFMGPLIMIRDQSRYPLSLGLFGMHVDQLADSTLIMAGNMLMTLPVILIFFLFQRYFIEGVTVSGMKG